LPLWADYTLSYYLLFDEGHGPAKGGLAALKFPGKTTEDQASVLHFRRADLTAQILNMDTIMGEEGVVS
jgi:hypothetical protein